MKRYLFFVLSLLLAFVCTSTRAQEGLWDYDEFEPLVTDYTQIRANAWAWNDGASTIEQAYQNLIDDDTSTYFHSCWADGDENNESFRPSGERAYHWLLFTLEEVHDSLLFHFEPRVHSSNYYVHAPSDIDIYMTNDTTDEDSWILVKEIRNLFGYDASITPTAYTSNLITCDTPCKFVKFVVLNANTSETSTNRYAAVEYQCFFALSEINWYVPFYNDDWVDILSTLVDSIATEGLTFEGSNDPGYYNYDAVEAYNEALEAAQEALYSDLTNEEYYELYVALKEALNEVLDNLNPMETGFYYVISGGEFWETDESTGLQITVDKAMYSDGSNLLWETYDESDATQIFYFIEKDNGYYSMYHPYSDTYVYSSTNVSITVPMTGDEDDDIYVGSLGSGLFRICGSTSSYSYHTASHNSGLGESGTIVHWATSYNASNRNIWYLHKIDDDELEQVFADYSQSQDVIDETLQTLVDSATIVYAECFTYNYDPDTRNGIITSTSQFTSNHKESAEGSYDYLIDYQTTTGFYHSIWKTSSTDYHNMQVKLNEPIDKFILAMFSRYNDNVDTPKKVRIFATNDATLGTDSVSDNDDWTEIGLYNFIVESSPGSKLYSYGIELDGSYQYIRFVMEEMTGGRSNGANYAPFYSVSEFQLIDYELDEENSQYSYISGMAEQVDIMMELATAAMELIDSSSGTQDDIAALRAQIATVISMMVSTDEYDDLLEEANELLASAVVGDLPGYVSQEVYDAFQAGIDNADEVLTLQPTEETIAAAIPVLQAAIDEFLASVNPVESDVWYYISNGSTSSTYGGAYLYGSSTVRSAAIYDGYIRYGGLDDEGVMTDAALHDLRYMWKFVQATDSTYYIYNRAYGMGPAAAGGSASYFTSETEFGTTSNGDGIVRFYHLYNSSKYYFYALSTSTWCSGTTSSTGTASQWQFTPVELTADNTGETVTVPVKMNDIRVQTYPFSVEKLAGVYSVMDLNEAVQTYEVKTTMFDEDYNSTYIVLSLKEEFDAGEPFVMLVGDYEQYEGYIGIDSSDTIDIDLPIPSEFATAPGTANGLVGNYRRVAYSDSEGGLGYIYRDNSSLSFKISSASTSFILWACSGYFVATQEEGDGEEDLLLEFEGGELTGIRNIKAEAEATAAAGGLYDLNGRLVNTSGSTDGLQKGIYIVGGKKVIVK